MKPHSSTIFEYDNDQTEKGYKDFNTTLNFTDKTWQKCLSLINEMSLRQGLLIGIDFLKPWEEIELTEYYQIEYLFVGKLFNKEKYYINDPLFGINVFQENRFGLNQFNSNNLLNLTLIIDKNKINANEI